MTKPTIHELEAILDSDQPQRVVVASDGQVRTEPLVTITEAIYGLLWRSCDLNMTYEAARRYALNAIGGKHSDGQRRAIEWACANFPPPDDSEIDCWLIDEAAGKGAHQSGMTQRILTEFISPPISQFDWRAWVDGTEETGPFGYGKTEAEAIAELKSILDDFAEPA